MNCSRPIGLSLLISALAVGSPSGNAADFSLIILPDSQYAVSLYPEVIAAQTGWIASNAVTGNIRAVGHVGDVVQNDVAGEWSRALSAMSRLDGVVPYIMATGNHDYTGGGYLGGSLFNSPTYFGPGTPYATQTGMAFESTNRTDAAFLTFRAGGGNWLILALPWDPSMSLTFWANSVVTNHPDHTVLVLTHDYLTTTGDARTSAGATLWDRLVRKHANILMVFCGHAVTAKGGVLTSVGDKGNTVYQMLSNYQQIANGGNGWLRLVDISHTGEVAIRTYSPYLNAWDSRTEHQFTFTFTNAFTTGRKTITGLSRPAGWPFELQWQSLTNRQYDIRWSPSLTTGGWTNLAEGIPATAPWNQHPVIPPGGRQGFFRIAVTNTAP